MTICQRLIKSTTQVTHEELTFLGNDFALGTEARGASILRFLRSTFPSIDQATVILWNITEAEIRMIHPQATIEDLPCEMLLKIFSHLKLKDRKNTSLVCRHWSQLPLPWADIRLHLCCSEKPTRERFLSSERPYRHLLLDGGQLAGRLLTKFGHSLETLKVIDVKEWDWLTALSGLANLRELHLNCACRYKPLNVDSGQPCPSLRCLTVEEIGSDVFPALNKFISETFPALTWLKVEYFTGTFSLTDLPLLEHFEIVMENDLDEALLQPLKTLPKLRSLALTGHRWECNYTESLVNRQIQIVVLNTANPLEDYALLQLTQLFPALTSFRFNGRTYCTTTGLETARKLLSACQFEIK